MSVPVEAPTEVAGLVVPAEMVPRVVAAMRGIYGQVASGIVDDETAVQAVLQFWVAQVLQTWEGLCAEEQLQVQLDLLRGKAYEERDRARDKAKEDAGKIHRKPPKPEPKPEREPEPKPEKANKPAE